MFCVVFDRTMLPLFATLVLLIPIINAEICTKDICKYEFVIRYDRTMVYRHPEEGAFDVQLNSTEDGFIVVPNEAYRIDGPMIGTSVGLNDVIAGDGYQRNIITINGQFPGPDIEVMYGAQVVVKVINKLHSDDITIHFHGMVQRGTTWMDGVPDLSQCAIPAGHIFTYRFRADPAGTHWYHSHVFRQRLYGLNGLLIVHPQVPVSLPYHLISVGDWFTYDGHTHHILDPSSIDPQDRGTGGGMFAARPLRDFLSDGVAASSLLWQSALINGKGRIDPKIKTPLTMFKVTRGKTYRFRMANVGSDYSLRISVDNHMLSVVATDGYDVEPVMVEYIIIHAGETIDFILEANQIGRRYWLRASSPIEPIKTHIVHEAKAVILYEPFEEGPDPTSQPRPCTATSPCTFYNCPFDNFPPLYNRTCINVNELNVLHPKEKLAEEYGVNDTDYKEFFFNMGFQKGISMNGIRYIKPMAPPFEKDAVTIDCEKECKDPNVSCACTHKIKLNHMETVQFVVSNFPHRKTVNHHPFHLHGHHFAVLHVGFPPTDEKTGLSTGHNTDVVCNDDRSICRYPHWNPDKGRPSFNTTVIALKNTIAVPAYGYVVLRFKADNPGFWLAHCHMASHQANGMTFMVEEAPDRIKPPPKGFPTCGLYDPSDEEFQQYLATGDLAEDNGRIEYFVDDKCQKADKVKDQGQERQDNTKEQPEVYEEPAPEAEGLEDVHQSPKQSMQNDSNWFNIFMARFLSIYKGKD